jgi:drug/metabolite transporter (DMT)-like permease
MVVLPRAALLLVSLLWGVSFVYTKPYLLAMNPIAFTAYNFLIAGVIFLLIARERGMKLSFRLREGVILGVFLFFTEAPQMIGLSETTAANTVFLQALGILLIPVLERVMYGRKIASITIVALIVAFVGANLLTGGVTHFNQGDMWNVISALGFLFYIVFLGHFEKEKKSGLFVLCTQQFLTCGILSLVAAVVVNAPLGLETAQASWLPLIVLTLLFTLIPYLLLQWAEKYASEVETTFYSILEPLIGGIAAWTIGAELATPSMVLGGVLIIAALVLSEFHRVNFRTLRRHLLSI